MKTTSLEFRTRWAQRGLRSAAALLTVGWFGLKLVPLPEALSRPVTASREFTDRHGATLREVRVEAESFRREVELDAVPPHVVRAMLAAEDKRFFDHHGVDPVAVARAVWQNARHGRVTSGASTITQQLVKISQPRKRTWWTKSLEAAQALRLEQLWTKKQILTAYLNRIDFGNLNVGLGAAAGYYLGKPLADLSEAEAAFLAGLPKNPTRLNPHRAFALTQRRQKTVLRRMERLGWLSGEQAQRARGEPLRLQPPQRLFRAPHFVDFVLRDLPSSHGRVQTTLDLDVNRFVENAVRKQLDRLHTRNVCEAAVVVLDNASGDVLALVGSQDYFAPGAGQVNGAWAPRSAGSTLKPFTYLLALERGATPATVVADVPALFPTPTGFFRPENYNHRCYGPIRYRLALANSLNIPAVRVLAEIGGATVLQERLRGWGLTSLTRPAEEYGLGLTIGNAEVRLIELVNAYATLARMGEWRPYRMLRDENAQPSTSAPNTTAHHSPLTIPATAQTPLAAWLIADMLSDNTARALAFGMQSPLRFEFPVACKTGTSSDFRDNWAVGYTPEFTVGVWCGNFDGSPMREVSGVTGAAPILHAVFDHLHRRFGTTWFERPTEIIERDVHPTTGRLLVESRADTVREKFITGHLPPLESPQDYDAMGRVVLGAEYTEWSRSAENGLTGRTSIEPATKDLRLLAPLPGTTFLVDPDLPSSRRVPLQASGPDEIRWESDSLEVRQSEGRVFAVAQQGRHRLTVRDPSTGRTVETWIEVKTL